MTAELAQDVAALTDTVRRFTLERIAPDVARWDEAGEFPRELYREAAGLGLLGLGYPEALGGTPAPFALRNAVSTTMARYGGSGGIMAGLFSLNIGLPPVLRHGSAPVQQEVIPPVLRGEKIAALAITEPGGGSDVAALRTTARRDGGDWVIDGEKAFITSGMRADWITMAVRTGDPEARAPAASRMIARAGRRAGPLAHSRSTRWAGGVPTPRSCAWTTCGCRHAICSARRARASRSSWANFNGERLGMSAMAPAASRRPATTRRWTGRASARPSAAPWSRTR